LKRRIVMIEIEPGSPLRETDVAASLGSGKTPVREALLRLSLEGLVRVRSRSGYTVAPVTLKSARDVCELRALLEGEAAHRAASARGGAIEELGAVDAAGRRAIAEHDRADVVRHVELLNTWLGAERAFHLALARASGNDLLARTLAGLLEGFARLCYLASALGSDSGLAAYDHAALVAAVSAGKPSEARALAVEEVRTAEALLIQALLSSESISTANVDPTPGARVHTFYLDVPKDADEGGRSAP
jgi:DNA-binding GntR family transcriptional regulator